MTGRKTLDQMTSDELDDLYERAERAEAAITRVRAVATLARQTTEPGLDDWQIGQHDLASAVLDALEPGPAATPATDPDRHAQSGIHTPGCDCGHDGMGTGWHPTDCPWRQAATHATEHPKTAPGHDEPPAAYRELLARLDREHTQAASTAAHDPADEVRLVAQGIASGLNIATAHAITVFEGQQACQAYLAAGADPDTPGPAATQKTEPVDEYEQTTGHVTTCTAVFTGICDCPPTEPTRPTPCDQYAGLLQEILYADHITSDRIARWRETLDNLTDQPQE